MKPPPFRYLRANTINEAVNALQSENEARILAGGQSLIAMMNLRVVYSKCLIDINSIEELDYIVERDDGIAVGALSRLCAIKDSAIVAEFCPLLAEAQDFIANKTVRNRATIGGNVCHADPAFEIPAVLIVARAVMVISGVGGQRVVDAENFFQGMYTTAVEENELLVEIRVPKIRQNAGTAIMEVSSRKGDFGIAVVAAHLEIEDGICSDVLLVCTGVGPHAVRIDAAEAALRGRTIDDGTIKVAGRAAYESVEPSSDFHADAIYRRELVEILVGRVLRPAAARAVGKA